MEIKRLSVALTEVKAEDDSRTIEGFGSVFGNVDSYGDIVMPGAFAKSIGTRMPKMLWQHDSDEPIGVWDVVEEQKKGLYMKGRILPTARGNDAYTLLKGGAITGLSIGFTTKKYSIDSKKNTRQLEEVELFEVSPVTFPANEKATITNVKAAHDNERDFEEFLRDAGGYSREAAKTIVAKGFKALSGQRDAEAKELIALREIADMFNQIKA